MKEQKKILVNTSIRSIKMKQKKININIDSYVLGVLVELEKINPELSKKAFKLLEYDIKHSHKKRQRILASCIKNVGTADGLIRQS